MAGNYTYDRVALQDSQDIADENETRSRNNSEATLRPSITPPGYSPLSPSEYRRVSSDRTSLNSFETFASSSSSTGSIEKIKNGFNRIRRKPVGGSIREQHIPETEFAKIGRGLWKDQLLVDRSLRSMAILTTLFAIAMIIVVSTNARNFATRPNKQSTSVGGEPQECHKVARTNTALLLLINVAATMVLGMSNTYQQLVTSLSMNDLKFTLEKFGDSRVGTNSPFNINHKREGKTKAWAAWALLISTSLPVHFLANSLIGPSFVLQTPHVVQYNESNYRDVSYRNYGEGEESITAEASFVCWSAFRTGAAHFSANLTALKEDRDDVYGAGLDRFGVAYNRIIVQYAQENCSSLANTTTDVGMVEGEWTRTTYGTLYYRKDNCQMGTHVFCVVSDQKPAQCRLNVRMQAAFILTGCLVLKAIYMVAVNLLARGKIKRQMLTFGDVIVASSSNPELRIEGECMVNASENYRRHTTHTCHKHCKSREPSETGDDIGHCQNCKKFNKVNKHGAKFAQPTIATKIKKSLISNLGNTALTQMVILMFCSFALSSATIFTSILIGSEFQSVERTCHGKYKDSYAMCKKPSTDRFAQISGGWGGMNSSLSIANLPPDQLSSELISICISNGAQFIYSLLYLMLVYNISLICQERDWGKLETGRYKLRCTIVKGKSFYQDYLLQLPKWVLFPIMGYSVLTHWMLGEALQTQEAIWRDDSYTVNGEGVEHSRYGIVYASYPLWVATFLILVMTGTCWWAFTYKREGFIPQMFGSLRVCCASTTSLDDFPASGVKWGDLGMYKHFRHAGLSAGPVEKIVPNELYAGKDTNDDPQHPLKED